MFDDDADLAELLGITPAETKPQPVPRYASFDPKSCLELLPRERFAALADVFAEIDADRKRQVEEARRVYLIRLEQAWRIAKGNNRRSFDVAKVEKEIPDAARGIISVLHAEVAAGDPARAKAKDLLSEAMREAADLIAVVSNMTGVYFTTVDEANFRSQPGAIKYAEARATLYTLDLAAMGVTSNINRYQSGGGTCFDVWAHVTEIDLPIVRKKTGLPMPKLVKAAWGLGVNPRVYWNFLPHGYEAEHGFDMMGRDIAVHPPLSEWAKPLGPLGPLIYPNARAIEIGLDFDEGEEPISLADLNTEVSCTAAVQTHSPDSAQTSESPEPEPC